MNQTKLRQTILVVSNDASLCAAARRELESRRPDVRVSAVSSVETALQIIEEAKPGVILLAEESGLQGGGKTMQLDSAVNALAVYAPVVVIGGAERETSLKALIATGIADYVPCTDSSMNNVLNLLEDRLARQERIAECLPGKTAEEWSMDFAEILRHELNNPLTGILANADLLLAEIARKKRWKAPSRRPGTCRNHRRAGRENARNGKAVQPPMGSEKRSGANGSSRVIGTSLKLRSGTAPIRDGTFSPR